jgi:pSer/pThr/pTyr-binding forkhead associated (FHA) protein
VAKIIITQGGEVLREVELDKERLTVGRHPQNDIVIEHRAVSGHHAAFTTTLNDAFLEDLGSTNGTFVNGERIRKRLLTDRDQIAMAVFQLNFVAGPRKVVPAPTPVGVAPRPLPLASIEVRNGVNAGRKLSLAKPLTTLGTPGLLVVVIGRQADGYFMRHVDGATIPLINGQAMGKDDAPLYDGDAIDLAGTAMLFSILEPV